MTTQAHPTSVLLDQEPLRPAQVAKMLGVTTNTLAIWRHYGRGPSYLKIGRQVRYPRELVDQFTESSLHTCNPEIKNLGHRR